MKNPREIIISPIFTEKSTQAQSLQNAYTFKVSINANKIEIKKAIEKVFSVDVVDVNTIRMYGKPKRLGRYEGRRPNWKKAVVTIKSGQSIADFEI
ncbi:MAG TPA: 50S ribosomal protein L23 [Candidatus Cloacimonadota bacterium]|jgi:large subunit ribosomal protein L23|nr:50S ribosomal protein L23 [Candidatus Cloacimonadales bacterium]HOE91512.1 50S ribosomal protein L23 [Candidatus Cloacimonadota bacterium]HOQ81012.1 50S ribosomal protein L23 [Candidatus Cloacimonadota bacterium]HPK40543.1 50S ribosomal protein L23 [Candidatus Cloacimonadota bacterium]HPY96903.1 50S ribosomal protein L23 [Candidatus Cloacimonadota bacterium]